VSSRRPASDVRFVAVGTITRESSWRGAAAAVDVRIPSIHTEASLTGLNSALRIPRDVQRIERRAFEVSRKDPRGEREALKAL
jgi:hypothetical protein